VSLSRELPVAAVATDAIGRAELFSVTRARFSRNAVAAGHLLLLWHCVRRAAMLFNPMVRLIFLRQVHQVGVMGLRAVVLLALTVGALFVTEATQLLGASNSYLYTILAWALVTEVAPLLVAVVVIGRSATVISTELALMKVRGELRFLEQLRIDPRDYLVLPRVAALTLSLLAATFYFQVVAICGGFAVSALLLNVSFAEQIALMLEAIPVLGVIFAGLKTLVFGLIISTVSCFCGLYAGTTSDDVPRAQVVTYTRSLTWLVTTDILFALATYAAY